MPGFPSLSASQREQLGDARLLLESAAHNAAMLLRHAQDGMDADRIQALENAAELANQAAAALTRLAADAGGGRQTPRASPRPRRPAGA
jgi:hypothetical protein